MRRTLHDFIRPEKTQFADLSSEAYKYLRVQ